MLGDGRALFDLLHRRLRLLLGSSKLRCRRQRHFPILHLLRFQRPLDIAVETDDLRALRVATEHRHEPLACMSESLRRLSVVVDSVLVPCALMMAKSNCVCCWMVTSARAARGTAAASSATPISEANRTVRMARMLLYSSRDRPKSMP